VMHIVELTRLSYPAVRRTLDQFEAGGVAAIAPAARGRRSGMGRSLSTEQEAAIRRTICDKRPEQLKMDFALWTRAAVMQLIERQCGIALSVRAVGNYLARWGFTPQKPIKRAYEQRPEAVQHWLDEQYPAIETRAKAERGEIHWGDETALVNTDVRGRGYAPRGQTPVAMAVGGTREKLSMISTVTNQGRANWMIVDGAFNHERLIEFLQALVKEGRKAGKKVFLILDNLGVHHCKPVKAWLADHQRWIEVFYLPSYSPELNPDERLNADLKHAIGSKVPVRTKAKLHAAATDHMARIEADPDRVKAYFQDPRVKYAA
jgi:transposase